jgi:hypothetical protein
LRLAATAASLFFSTPLLVLIGYALSNSPIVVESPALKKPTPADTVTIAIITQRA